MNSLQPLWEHRNNVGLCFVNHVALLMAFKLISLKTEPSHVVLPSTIKYK